MEKEYKGRDLDITRVREGHWYVTFEHEELQIQTYGCETREEAVGIAVDMINEIEAGKFELSADEREYIRRQNEKTITNDNVEAKILSDLPLRYCLKNSAAFDYPPFTYHIEKYKAAVKRAGGQNVRESNGFYWRNQPRVVTWTGNRRINKAIKAELYNLPPFNAGSRGLPSPIIIPHYRG